MQFPELHHSRDYPRCIILQNRYVIRKIGGRAILAPPFRRRRLAAADSALDNSAPCRFGAGHFGAVSYFFLFFEL